MKQDLVLTSVPVYKMCSMCTFLSKKVLFCVLLKTFPLLTALKCVILFGLEFPSVRIIECILEYVLVAKQ